MFKCLYNLEMLIISTGNPPFQSYDEPIKPETPANYIYQLKDTDVDAVMICPTAWKLPLWDSKVIPHWKEEAAHIQQPYFTADLKYHEKAYFRVRDFMMAGNDPVGTAVEAAKKCGIAPFISYRMNDHHYLNQETAFVHPRFWRENPQLWLKAGEKAENDVALCDGERYFDYYHEEVRRHYYSLLEELVSMYDVEGVELDFMRSPTYFDAAHLEEGRGIMTEFVRSIREMLDTWGKKRGKQLKLCVRVPYTTKWCHEVGLDVERWDAEKLIDMVNVSTYFICSPKVDVAGYKKIVKNSAMYGEMHFIVDKAKLYNGFMNNCHRKTTKEMYRALAATYLDQGMDGVSFFNTDYARHHFFNEPRRLHMKDPQPPLEDFNGISDLKHLQKLDKHYFVGPNYSELPQVNYMDLQLYVAEPNVTENFKHAILRIKTQEPCQGLEIAATVNGQSVEEIVWMGELFPPLSMEGAAAPQYVKYYQVPVELLKHGINRITAKNLCDDPTLWDKRAVFEFVELAVYKENSFLN